MGKKETGGEILERLFAVIDGRRGADPETSYTAKMFAKGRSKITQKLGEEAVETVIAALSQGRDEVVSESADLIYHLLILWAEQGIDPAEVWAELARREGTSGIDEKKARSGKTI
ncbi:MAG: phosphoribosyl-ATP diphosphatase [Rhodospirillales bacterium]|nr:phosphoribosyl-ATP diphosphatase [Rhodospirillales bacterium]MCW8951108.1 phosphoribosyl-ATP diphosphatase [Rhodospirillales bacterium]MCW8969768.1 phosphoribosyl-ATP diphosphatase [Rhodospirillales bacterium]MCW9003526.1 phosphoribosyl-ATP diphosphatase [Rhodospirillales bacterium]